MVSNLEEVRDGQLELVKKVFMDSLTPFHEMSEHCKELEKFVHRSVFHMCLRQNYVNISAIGEIL